ncbi:MAG: CDP-6-deoxy-delta-3,4-glucoseen reductase [Nitrosomonadales bacterium]|nr:CDP-6-deoxy-delta-3,4-glucoseen reductase [Nitrosomonadales bacterium]
MSFNVQVQPSGHSFAIEENETILEAASRNKITLPYGCRNGACGVCKGRVLQGEIDHGNAQSFALSDAEKADGLTLYCCAKAKSDVVIESHEVGGVSQIQVKTLPSRVQKMEKVAPDVMLLWLKLPANEKLEFLAGQYIDILTKDGKARSFSLANAPHEGDMLELHVRNITGGSFTHYVFNELKERDIMRFKGPLGTFFLREDSDKPILFVASGTGFAPVKALIEHALHIGVTRPMHFYWGARTLADLYLLNKAHEWETRGVKFTPVLSDALPEDNWTGRTGFVHQAVLEDYVDLASHQVYACGAPVVVEAAHRDYTTQRGLPNEEFYSDAFTFAPKA